MTLSRWFDVGPALVAGTRMSRAVDSRRPWAARPAGDLAARGAHLSHQWGDDRERVLERMREGFRWIRGSRIMASDPAVQVDARRAIWVGKITLYSSDDGVMEVLDQRVNKLPTPFELEWRRVSGKPWDWQLVSVSNSGFEIPADMY